MGKEEEKKKVKKPSALKRGVQNERKRMRNRIFKSKVRTATNSFEQSIKSGAKEEMQSKLQLVYSLMDKGVKRGIFKKNKAARVKSRLNQRCS